MRDRLTEWNQYTLPPPRLRYAGGIMTQREIWNFKSWLCFFCHSGKKPNLVSIVSSKLHTFMMGNAIYFNIILSLRFVKGFVPACCPVCTRRKKICKHLCHYVPIYMYIYKGNVLIMDCTCISFTFFVEVKAHAHQRCPLLFIDHHCPP